MKRIASSWKPIGVFGHSAFMLMFIASLLLGARTASAQTVQQRLDAMTAHMKYLQDLSAKLPAAEKGRLSSSAQHLLRVAAEWDRIGPQLARSAATLSSPLNGKPFNPGGPLPPGTVSDPSTDVAISRLAGFVQNETSTSWCGDTVLVGYNDSGSFLETFPIPGIGLSFNGYSRSTDGGQTFTDLGFLNPGANVFNFLEGDPVVKCTDANTFYYSSIFATSSSTGAPLTGASVSKSTDGGQTFADPVPAVLKDAFFHIIDKPWMAVNTRHPNNVYVTYSDFDFTGFSSDPNAICPGTIRVGIELVRSTDGGATWSAPTVVDNGCFPNEDQGSNVAVDEHNVYVAWEQFPAFIPTNEIDIARSKNGGASFGPKSVVAIVTPVGHSLFGLLQGGFRNNEFPSLAIGRSGEDEEDGKTLYIAFNDGRNGVTPDGFPPFFGATYNFGDAFVTRSNNKGATWSAPVKVNDDIGAASGIDHYLPGIAASWDGSLGVCWYDRRRDPENFLIDRECATSRDRGRTWTNTLITMRNFSPIIADDLLINPVYMGDYDGVAADNGDEYEGFLGAYGDNAHGNPDVRISRRFGAPGDSGTLDDN